MNLFPLILVKVSTCRKKRSNKRKGFHKTENPSQPYGMKNSVKNTFPLDKKYLSLVGVSEKWEKITSTSQKTSVHEQK